MMTLYKVYYKRKNAKNPLFSKGVWYVEISDEYGKNKAKQAREEFYKVSSAEFYEVYRVVRDC